MALSDTFGALRERQFRLLWLGQATSTIGDGLLPVALAFAVIESLDGTATQLGLVLAAHTLPLVAFVLIGGVWADRLPRQLVMLASDLIRCAVQAVLAILFLTGAAELWHLVTLIAVYGAAQAFFQPAATGIVPATVSPQRLQQANAMLGLTRSGAFVIGPAIAGAVVAVTNPGFVFAVDAATFAISATSLALLRVPRRVRERARESFLAELAGGWRELVSRTWLWVIIVWATTILFAVVAPFQTLGPMIAKQSLGGAASVGDDRRRVRPGHGRRRDHRSSPSALAADARVLARVLPCGPRSCAAGDACAGLRDRGRSGGRRRGHRLLRGPLADDAPAARARRRLCRA